MAAVARLRVCAGERRRSAQERLEWPARILRCRPPESSAVRIDRRFIFPVEPAARSGATSGSDDHRFFGFPEYRVVATYREPRAFGLNADFLFTAAVEQGVRSSSTSRAKASTRKSARRLGPGLRTNARYSFSTTRTFQNGSMTENQARIDRLFPRSGCRCSRWRHLARYARRRARSGARHIRIVRKPLSRRVRFGGQVGFLKSYVQGFWFHRLPVQIAGRLRQSRLRSASQTDFRDR